MVHRSYIAAFSFTICILALCWPVFSVRADTIYLKSGSTIEGKVSREEEDRLRIVSDTEMGIMTISVPRQDIEKVEINEGGEEIIEQCAKSLFYFQKANTYYNDKNYQQAIEAYSRVIELNPKWAEAYYNLGLAYAKSSLYEEARKNFDYALELARGVRSQTQENKRFIQRIELQLKNIP